MPDMPEASAIESVIEAMTKAFARSDLAGILATYEPAAVVVGPAGPAQGREGMTALFEGFFAVKPRFSFHGHEVVTAGDIAVHLMKWDMTATAPDGSGIKDGGLSVAVLRRQPDGSWRMVIDHPNGDRVMRA